MFEIHTTEYYFRLRPKRLSVKMPKVFRVLFKESGKKRLLSAEDNFKDFVKCGKLLVLEIINSCLCYSHCLYLLLIYMKLCAFL